MTSAASSQRVAPWSLKTACYSARAVRASGRVHDNFCPARVARHTLLHCVWIGLLLGVGSLAQAGMVVEGQMFDTDGNPIAGAPVKIVGQFGKIPFSNKPPTERELIAGTTDPYGFFALELSDDRGADRMLVRSFEATRWDHVRHAPEPDVDVTRDLRRHGRAIVTLKIDDASGWAELQREWMRVGANTARGKILRTHGYPAETIQRSDGGVEWRYPSVRYQFDAQGKLVRTIETGGQS